DAVHMSRPDRDGQIRAMQEALDESGLAPADIGYINAHGTATAVGDVVEAEAINAVFQSDAPLVSSTKSLHGHLLGGAGALELAVAVIALEQGLVAPTAFLEQPDPAIQLSCVGFGLAWMFLSLGRPGWGLAGLAVGEELSALSLANAALAHGFTLDLSIAAARVTAVVLAVCMVSAMLRQALRLSPEK